MLQPFNNNSGRKVFFCIKHQFSISTGYFAYKMRINFEILIY